MGHYAKVTTDAEKELMRLMLKKARSGPPPTAQRSTERVVGDSDPDDNTSDEGS